jgi:acetylcholinesterase
MVWFYGGGFLMGADFPYEPTTLVKQSVEMGEPIIVVTFNYRIGALGFLAGKAMHEQASKGNVDLNVGLHDQRGALRWIKRNIEQFGGDATRITLAGESAGGQSISYQLLSQHGEAKDEDLFQQAIIQSGGTGMAIVHADNSRHEHHYRSILGATPCSRHESSSDQIACLRDLSPAAMSAANVRSMMYVIGITSQASWKTPLFFPYWPTLDADFISESPYNLWMQGKYKDVPMIFGSVLDEGTAFTPHDLHNESITIPWIRRSLLPADELTRAEEDHTIQRLLDAYPDIPSKGSPFAHQTEERLMQGSDNQYKRIAAAIGDIAFQAPRRFNIRQHSLLHSQGKKKSPAWNYLLAEAGPSSTTAQGVPHGADNDYLFRPMAAYLFFRPPVDFRKPGSRWEIVSKTMTTAWIGFINNGHPNRKGSPKWPYYASPSSKHRLALATLQIQAYNNTIIPDDYREEALTDTLIKDDIVRKALRY